LLVYLGPNVTLTVIETATTAVFDYQFGRGV